MDLVRTISQVGKVNSIQGYNLNEPSGDSDPIQVNQNDQGNNQETQVNGFSTGTEIADLISGNKQDRIESAIAHLNKIAQDSKVNVQLEYNKEADRVEIKFVDGQSRKVVKQIPSDSVLDMDVQIRKFIGVLFDKMV